jgi:hypothetical protein
MVKWKCETQEVSQYKTLFKSLERFIQTSDSMRFCLFLCFKNVFEKI